MRENRAMKGGDILIECLKAQGVQHIFGMPGTQNIQIYDSLLRQGSDTIKHYLVRHENAATLMADGYARSSGEVGVALTVPGPGASNASTGLLEALTDCVPVLLITGQSDSNFYNRDPSKMFHGLDQMRFFEPITKYCDIAKTIADIPVVVGNAFQAMKTGRPGPTMLEFPMDVITGEDTVTIPDRIQRHFQEPAKADDVQLVVQHLNKASSPIILAGSAVIHSCAMSELQNLAEKLNAPVIVTRCAKGALSEDHPLALQNISDFQAKKAMQVADCTLAIGCRFTSIDTRNWSFEPPRPLVQIDEDPAEINREYPCDLGITGDLKSSLQILTDQIETGKSNWSHVLSQIQEEFATQPHLPILPELRRVLSEDAIVAIDVHSIGYASFTEFPVYHPQTFLYPCIGVTLGYAFPAAIGAKIAHPDKPVVCFTGDGGFMMGAAELATAMMYGINVVTVVVNDGALTAIKGSQQKGCDGRTIDTDLYNPDFIQFAKSFGAYAARVDDLANFEEILKEALESKLPAIIEVPMQDKQNNLIDIIGWLQPEPLRKTQF